MENLRLLAIIPVLIFSCQSETDWVEVRQRWGSFESNQIKTERVDYKESPYYEHVINHKGAEAIAFMDSIELEKIAYLSDSLLITGFMMMPKYRASEKLPVVVFNRGGNRDMGRLTIGLMIETLSPLVQKGYLVIASNYRGNSSSEGKDEFGGNDVHDVINLIKGLPSIQQADTSRIGMVGISRGGMMGYQTIKLSNKVKSLAVIGGMSDLQANLSFHKGMEEVYQELIPDYKTDGVAKLKDRSAYYWTDKMNRIPLLILHGTKDEHVSVEETRKFVSKLNGLNFSVQYKEFDDNHGLIEHHPEMYQLLFEHFDKSLNSGN